MTTKLKRWLDGTRRSRKRLSIPSRAKNHPRGAILLKESSKTSLRIYHTYHALENQVARRKAELDKRILRQVNRVPQRKAIIRWRNNFYNWIKAGKPSKKEETSEEMMEKGREMLAKSGGPRSDDA